MLTIPDSIVSIGYSAFGGTHISFLILGDSVTSIGDKAFLTKTGLALKFGKIYENDIMKMF